LSRQSIAKADAMSADNGGARLCRALIKPSSFYILPSSFSSRWGERTREPFGMARTPLRAAILHSAFYLLHFLLPPSSSFLFLPGAAKL